MALLSHFHVRITGFSPKTLIKPDFNTPSLVVKPYSGGKTKKALFYLLLSGVGVFLAYSFLPGFPKTAFLASMVEGAFYPHIPETSAQTLSYNSQTVRVLEPAFNIDPNPSKGDGDITVVDGSVLVPESGPSGTSADLAQHHASSEISVYVVHKGDTLGEIASMFGVSKETIMWANNLKSGTVREGESLIILPITGVSHTIAKGDTVASIAKKYKADEAEIRAYNGLSEGGTLALGSAIIIPDGEVQQVVATTPAKKTTTSTAKNPYRGGSGSDLGTYFIWPVDGGVVTQGIHGYNSVDIGAPTGTAVYAAAEGLVLISRDSGWNGGYGNYVVISHDNGVQTLYGHMSRVVAQAGTRINQGDLVGYVGMTGKVTGPHLHFEVRGAKNPFTK